LFLGTIKRKGGSRGGGKWGGRARRGAAEMTPAGRSRIEKQQQKGKREKLTEKRRNDRIPRHFKERRLKTARMPLTITTG